jgi:hypothetical protein
MDETANLLAEYTVPLAKPALPAVEEMFIIFPS